MQIEYFYASYSAFAYLGSVELARIADRTGATILHRPMDLRAVVSASGSQPFGERSKNHIEYFFRREIARWAEHRDLPIMDGMPTHHGNEIRTSNCLLIAAAKSGLNVGKLSEDMFRAHWAEDADLASRADLEAICTNAGVDAAALFDLAGASAIQAEYDENTREAIRRGVFGSPTYFVGDDMFYGQDRLELVERALSRPYKGRWLPR
ncbi:2-hydroxychromene-2-carboxylate isomerase [Sneathiella chinensis]|uniref:2-hydroxychromene-2-carboxylate isomerase n=1 Tax=Sneathiella chinensis TaxID=349750 RepID=A0ABQ5U493_9PROT|nr:2-hydroxychromene-2-carboxylate isomerase [Sneathiella chinensis]GLQ06099.1 2-hydroxychromene-2-carboxylate isomerase [Sneathiella chinensis]